MSHVAVIVGVSGEERFLADHRVVSEKKQAKKFRSEASAETAAKAHIAAFPAVIQRHMTYQVVPA